MNRTEKLKRFEKALNLFLESVRQFAVFLDAHVPTEVLRIMLAMGIQRALSRNHAVEGKGSPSLRPSPWG
jgi:hypothetical protein